MQGIDIGVGKQNQQLWESVIIPRSMATTIPCHTPSALICAAGFLVCTLDYGCIQAIPKEGYVHVHWAHSKY